MGPWSWCWVFLSGFAHRNCKDEEEEEDVYGDGFGCGGHRHESETTREMDAWLVPGFLYNIRVQRMSARLLLGGVTDQLKYAHMAFRTNT